MKKALLWLGPLACLALACLYAYAWFTRDPLVVSFERIEIGMSQDQVTQIVGRPGRGIGVFAHDRDATDAIIWHDERYILAVTVRCFDGEVVSKDLIQFPLFESILRCVRVVNRSPWSEN